MYIKKTLANNIYIMKVEVIFVAKNNDNQKTPSKKNAKNNTMSRASNEKMDRASNERTDRVEGMNKKNNPMDTQ